MRSYTLFTTGPRGDITNRSIKYGCDYPWIVTVRARSVSEAYSLLARQVVAKPGSVGVTRVDRKEDKQCEWPWTMPTTAVCSH